MISKAHLIEKLLVDMETGKRGFLITGTEHFLEPYTNAKYSIYSTIEELKKTVDDNPTQIQNLISIYQSIQIWEERVVNPKIEERRKFNKSKNDGEYVTNLNKAETGKNLIDKLRYQLEHFILIEKNLLSEREKKSKATSRLSKVAMIIGAILGIVTSIIFMIIINKSVKRQIGGDPSTIANIAKEISLGNLDPKIEQTDYNSKSIFGSVLTMLKSLKEKQQNDKQQDWIKTGLVQLDTRIHSDLTISEFSHKTIQEICVYLKIQIGSLYLYHVDKEVLKLQAGYAHKTAKNHSSIFKLGEGLVGQVALNKQQ